MTDRFENFRCAYCRNITNENYYQWKKDGSRATCAEETAKVMCKKCWDKALSYCKSIEE